MGESEQTLGEKRVRASFNPSGDGAVDRIKTLSAQLIDCLEDIKRNVADPEGKRLCAQAQTDYEAAAMWAVKAATFK